MPVTFTAVAKAWLGGWEGGACQTLLLRKAGACGTGEAITISSTYTNSVTVTITPGAREGELFLAAKEN